MQNQKPPEQRQADALAISDRLRTKLAEEKVVQHLIDITVQKVAEAVFLAYHDYTHPKNCLLLCEYVGNRVRQWRVSQDDMNTIGQVIIETIREFHAAQPKSRLEIAKDRLKAIETELRRRGAVDVKFTLAPNIQDFCPEEVSEHVADFFEAYLAGNLKPMTDFGDPPYERRGEGVMEHSTIDLDLNMWESIKQAASESKWIPQDHYFMNDWAYDVRQFLLHGNKPHLPEGWEITDTRRMGCQCLRNITEP